MRPSGNSRIRRGLCGVHLLAAAIVSLLLLPAAASGQQTVRDVVTFLVTNQAVQTGDFVKDLDAARATSDTISRALLASLATLPTSASSAGFTYRFNPSLGTLERTSTSFGPTFIERATTSGAGRVAFGGSWQYARFTKLDGQPLRDGTLVTISNQFEDEDEPFDIETLRLEIETAIVTGFATVGVTDRLDIGVAVPFIWLDLQGDRLNAYRGNELVQAQATVSSSGVGDIAIRAKYDLVSGPAGFAAAGELRLPTGREEDLLGSGSRAVRLLAVASLEGAAASAHANIGWGQGGVSDELTYAAGVAFVPQSRLTISGELVGRHLFDIGRITETIAPHPSIAGVQTLRLSSSDESRLTAVNAIAAMKWNIGQTWLLKASVITPMNDAGLISRLRTTIGLDYAFGD